jgi:hypothetical protein
MQTLQIILTLMGIVAYVVTVTFALYAFSRLKRQEEDLKGLKVVAAKTLALVMADHLRDSFEALNDMKETLHDLIDDERFEEAEQLKATIAKAEHAAMRELERFKESFGEDCVDLKVTSIRIE